MTTPAIPPNAWLEVLRAEVKRGGVVATARLLGISHTSVSTALNGRYPAKTTRLEAKVLKELGHVDCPHLACEITGAECAIYRTRSVPQSDPAKLKHWAACRRCPIGAAFARAEAAGA